MRGSFPWGTLLCILANQGLVFMGWPHGALMPSQLRNENVGTKGITDLSLTDCRLLYSAFINKDISIMKLRTTEERSKFPVSSTTPVIVSGAPPADSLYPNGQQMYADGTIDHDGLPVFHGATWLPTSSESQPCTPPPRNQL
ncbi:hypothetical protein PAXRUDRAFT_157683 [Paxillus rubicundulus Ve08.2h10]|uniref:Uncharacterized protein n=1 Tax=Paxillus rubicundulus Ve08.2h10 TaxID=930991 RepID=A0A0D0CYR1_9AGAM|nr:hypothetical protein PAXRUDRAFT_157683 [Paxillus rubicundulus Ve08.2h10]